MEIYDFFAGEGQDSIDTPGSPLIILNELRGYCENLVQKNTRLTLLFNDFSKSKYQKLIDSKDNFLRKCSQNKRYGFCKNFISSSYLNRFKELPEFKKYIDDNDIDFSESRPTQCHRVVFEYFKRMVNKQPYFLGQFSIKKGNNVYGLIFGSNSHLGMRKFLDVAWKMDPHTGEANHDIDDDPIRLGQLSFDFDAGANKFKKLYSYELSLIEFIKTPGLNKELYVYSLEQGISITKTIEILKRLENESKLSVEGFDRQKGAFYLDYIPKKQIIIKSK